MKVKNNIFNTALIFEGGGMRASYTAGIVCVLLDAQIYFDYAAGISAGATHCVNYLSRDASRAKRSFVDLADDKNFSGWNYFIKGKGYFNSEYIYGQTPYIKSSLPFDFKTFTENTANFRIGAFDMIRGKMKYFSREDICDIYSLMKFVQASSSMPFFMPYTKIGDDMYIDGGLGGGIAYDIAEKDGFDKYFVILTRPKGYRKKPIKLTGAIKTRYRNFPGVIEAMLNRHVVYNKTLDELEKLEKDGKAYLIYPDVMPITSMETDYKKLYKSFEMGYGQGRRDIERYKEFLAFEKEENVY
jgi:predicted patatin/cPLA2 family phospholipase